MITREAALTLVAEFMFNNCEAFADMEQDDVLFEVTQGRAMLEYEKHVELVDALKAAGYTVVSICNVDYEGDMEVLVDGKVIFEAGRDFEDDENYFFWFFI